MLLLFTEMDATISLFPSIHKIGHQQVSYTDPKNMNMSTCHTGIKSIHCRDIYLQT